MYIIFMLCSYTTFSHQETTNLKEFQKQPMQGNSMEFLFVFWIQAKTKKYYGLAREAVVVAEVKLCYDKRAK